MIKMSEENMHFIEKHHINLKNVQLDGRILDIGGGGEGVIGLYKGEKVISIDRRKSELEEAADGKYLKIIMDATDLQFLNETFDTITAFYMLMYVPMESRQKIFEETFRVLKKGGDFVLWDMLITEKEDNKEDLYVAEIEVNLGEKVIETAYGTHWNKIQDLNYFSDLGKLTGFNIIEKQEENTKIFIRFRKPG